MIVIHVFLFTDFYFSFNRTLLKAWLGAHDSWQRFEDTRKMLRFEKIIQVKVKTSIKKLIHG